MLQQTRVETVTPYFERFMQRFPTPLALAETPEDEVLAAWSGLGYYRRARMLHAGARHVAHDKRGVMPGDREGLLSLPGVGRYTAGAIASIAYDERVGLVDGNVARVFARLFGIDDDMKSTKGMKRAESLSEKLVAEANPKAKPAFSAGDWNQALMELGATICTPRSPKCGECPVSKMCVAFETDRVQSLPVIGEKKKPKPQEVQALIARTKDGKQILLARRRSDGLFGGLWEPPSIDGGAESKGDLFARFPIDPKTIEARGRVTHVLSHRRLSIDVHVAVLTTTTTKKMRFDPNALDLPPAYEAAGLFDENALDTAGIGLATLARKVLAAKAP